MVRADWGGFPRCCPATGPALSDAHGTKKGCAWLGIFLRQPGELPNSGRWRTLTSDAEGALFRVCHPQDPPPRKALNGMA